MKKVLFVLLALAITVTSAWPLQKTCTAPDGQVYLLMFENIEDVGFVLTEKIDIDSQNLKDYIRIISTTSKVERQKDYITNKLTSYKKAWVEFRFKNVSTHSIAVIESFTTVFDKNKRAIADGQNTAFFRLNCNSDIRYPLKPGYIGNGNGVLGMLSLESYSMKWKITSIEIALQPKK